MKKLLLGLFLLTNICFADTLTVYPDAGTGGTTMSGNPERNSVDETLATIRAGAGVAIASGAIQVVGLTASTTNNQFARLVRFLATFDTSSIGAGNQIDSAILSLKPWTSVDKENGLGDVDIHISSSTPADDGTFVTADYSQVGATSFSSIAYADWNSGAYEDFTLNSSGEDNIDMEGISKFSAQTNWDINGSFTGTWASAAASTIYFRGADQTGTADDPKISGTFSAAVTDTGFFLMF